MLKSMKFENKKTIEKMNETKGWYLEVIYEMDEPLTRLIQTEGDKIHFPYRKQKRGSHDWYYEHYKG